VAVDTEVTQGYGTPDYQPHPAPRYSKYAETTHAALAIIVEVLATHPVRNRWYYTIA